MPNVKTQTRLNVNQHRLFATQWAYLRQSIFDMQFVPYTFRFNKSSLMKLLRGRGGRSNSNRRSRRVKLHNRPTPAKFRPHPIYHLSPAGVSSRRPISRRRAPLEECFPCVVRNAFSVHLTFSSLCYCREPHR